MPSGALDRSDEVNSKSALAVTASGLRLPRPTTSTLPLWLRLRIKRGIDVTVSPVALLFLLPLMAIIALAIRLDSPGAPIFTQLRVGQNRRRRVSRPDGPERRKRSTHGSEFRILKFRTMRVDCPGYSRSPLSPLDDRVTRLGRFLRRTCLDELPQFINVLAGEMSLVGPRPEMPFIVSEYDRIVAQRLDVKPGITGLWQVRGPRDRAIHEAVEYDLFYARHWSLRLDFAIVLETVLFMLRRRNH